MIREKDVIRLIRACLNEPSLTVSRFVELIDSDSMLSPWDKKAFSKVVNKSLGAGPITETGIAGFADTLVYEASSVEYMYFVAKLLEKNQLKQRAYNLYILCFDNGMKSLNLVIRLGKIAFELGDKSAYKAWLKEAIDLYGLICRENKVSDAINAESIIYESLIKLVEDDEHVTSAFTKLGIHTQNVTKKVQDKAPFNATAITPEIANRIAFCVPNGVMLAHTTVLISILSLYSSEPAFDICPTIFVVGGICDENFRNACDEALIPYVYIPYDSREFTLDVYAERIEKLRTELQIRGISRVVWVSVPSGCSWYLGSRIAAEQAYWTMKFHAQATREIDIFISCASIWEKEKIVAGKKWVTGPVTFPDALSQTDAAKAKAIKSEFPQDAILLGVLARAEKIYSGEYLEAVSRILRKHPNTIFLWTGRTKHEGIAKHFDDSGLSGRVQYVGWVDTATYALVLDVFLETFPFGCGLTAAQALAAGTALVSYRNWSTIYGHHLSPVLDGRAGDFDTLSDIESIFRGEGNLDRLLMAKDPEQYVELASSVVQSPDFRESVGEAGKIFYRKYLGNPRISAQRFAEIFMGSIDNSHHIRKR